ncbi:MAG TPA: methyltransferase domain-containing protein [Terracidiphilus sp.]|jgi:ubiquinone/menaquinone biosynthesis C-methylase UbiE|nr:methyltransferase domain-containing protein [Terracidiphilus sp.]
MTTLTMRKPHADRPIEGMMAKWYAANTGEMMQQYVDLAKKVAGQLPAGSCVLEVAPGPGYFCIELAKRGRYTITGMDLSHSFVKMAAEKAAEAGVKAEFVQGSASNMPFPKETFDFLLCRAAFKNFADPVGALQEMCRVLKPGGRGMLIDLSRDAQPDAVSREIDKMGLSTVNRLLTKVVFKTMLIRSAYTRAEFEQMLAQTQFGKVEIANDGMGFEITMTK